MERIRVLVVIVLFWVVARESDASSRVLMADGKGDDKLNSEKVSPSPASIPSPKNNVSESSQKPPQKKSLQSPPPAANSTTTSLKTPPSSGNATNLVPPRPSGPENNNNGKNSQRSEVPTKSGSPTDRSQENACHASAEKCRIDELVACLQPPGHDSKGLFLLVQNTGESTLTAKIKVTPPINIYEKIQIAKGNNKTISMNAMSGLEIVINAGKGNCILHTKTSFFNWNPVQQFPSYATHLTPIYGAYFLFVTMVIAGGTWACCKFRRGRRDDTGIAYQQLEMGAQTQSSSAVVDSNKADDWDEGWDEEWDEEEAVPQASEKLPTGSVSANGLTSRSPRKDGWDVDWDD